MTMFHSIFIDLLMMSLSLLGFTYGTRFIETAPAIFLVEYGRIYQYKLISNPIKLYGTVLVRYLNNKRKLISNSLNVSYNYTTVYRNKCRSSFSEHRKFFIRYLFFFFSASNINYFLSVTGR